MHYYENDRDIFGLPKPDLLDDSPASKSPGRLRSMVITLLIVVFIGLGFLGNIGEMSCFGTHRGYYYNSEDVNIIKVRTNFTPYSYELQTYVYQLNPEHESQRPIMRDDYFSFYSFGQISTPQGQWVRVK